MTEGRNPKGEPEPPDTGDSTTAARQRKIETTDEPEVEAYEEQPISMNAPESAATGETGEPEPPDTGT